MRIPIPKSLSGQTVSVLLIALIVSHLIGLMIYAIDRRKAVMNTEAHDLADRVVGMVKLLERIPKEWRTEIVRESDGRTFHVMLGSAPDVMAPNLDEALSNEVARYLGTQFPSWAADRIRVGLLDTPLLDVEKILNNQSIRAPETSLEDRIRQRSYKYLHISMRLDGSEWLNLVGALSQSGLMRGGSTLAYIVTLALGIGIFAIWLVFRVTAPLNDFARAADRLGKDLRAEPLPETGPAEVVEAARAFNGMQDRLKRLVQSRSQMLAGISHDLRTPLTLSRLRAEAIVNVEERLKLLNTLDEMEVMIASVLEYTKATVLDEPQRRVDLSALLGSLCEDLADMGADIETHLSEKVFYECRRVGLKRALTNIIDNALKYGHRAKVQLQKWHGEIEILIDDYGPGIPEELQEAVFLPYQRANVSRNSSSSGFGLGLSIAQTIIHGHGGKILLANRPTGGLRVRILLPI